MTHATLAQIKDLTDALYDDFFPDTPRERRPREQHVFYSAILYTAARTLPEAIPSPKSRTRTKAAEKDSPPHTSAVPKTGPSTTKT